MSIVGSVVVNAARLAAGSIGTPMRVAAPSQTDTSQLLRPELPRQCGRGRRRHRRHRRQPLPGYIAALTIQGDQAVPAQQLALRQRHRQLARGHTTVALV
jgi:hypothetical protein